MTNDDFQWFLDEISICFVERDFDRWVARILLPMSLITKDGPVLLTTLQELEENFNHYLVAMDVMGLTRVYRLPRALEDCKDGTWIGTYETYLMRGTIAATRPYASSALLEDAKDGPRMRSIMNARGHHEWTRVKP